MYHLTRRNFLKAVGLSGAGLVLVACQSDAAAPAAEAIPESSAETNAEVAAPAASARGFIESPMLAERVAAGTLPPIDERLPAEVFVVGPGLKSLLGRYPTRLTRPCSVASFLAVPRRWRAIVTGRCPS